MGKKIGLYFGSFNPVHIGHLIVANHIVEYTDMDEVWFVVSPQNPFKDKKSLALEYDRLEMVNIALEPYDKLRSCDIEFRLPKPSYTADTLLFLTQKFPEDEFAIIVGADSLKDFDKWKNYEFILKYFDIYVYPRPGYESSSELFDSARLRDIPEAPQIQISASQIRRDIKSGKNVRPLLPVGVLEYIEKNNIYR